MAESLSSQEGWLFGLKKHLHDEQYRPGYVGLCIAAARNFVAFLHEQNIAITEAQSTTVESYLKTARPCSVCPAIQYRRTNPGSLGSVPACSQARISRPGPACGERPKRENLSSLARNSCPPQGLAEALSTNRGPTHIRQLLWRTAGCRRCSVQAKAICGGRGERDAFLGGQARVSSHVSTFDGRQSGRCRR